MPDLLELYHQQKAKSEEKENQQIPEQEESLYEYGKEKGLEDEQSYSLEGTTTGDPETDNRQKNTALSSQFLGALSTQTTRERRDDPTTWSPEYTDKYFMAEFGDNIMRGVGNSFIKGSGDLLQVVGGLIDKDLIEGTFLSKALQEAGTDFASKFEGFIPEELQHENITWKSMMDPKFWSIHVAEMIPNVVQYLFLAKGGAMAAEKLGSSLLKNLPGATKTALGKTIVGTGKGISGALATDIGLTTTGKVIANTIGGGVAGNLFAGLQNAAELVNQNKDLMDENGNQVFTEEDLQNMASGTVKSNANWMLIDMASWGLTFGKGGKLFKNLNPISKGGKLYNKAQQMKIASNMFAYDVAPIIKGVSRVAGKAGFEGFEEMYQESFEEWAKKKAYADVTGEDMPYNNDFFEFFKSKENEATKVLSAAMGALAGGAFNIKSLLNTKADDHYRLYDRTKNLTQIINGQGSTEELEWQKYHIQQTIADIVIDDKHGAYDDFMNGLIKRGNITEEERATYDEMLYNFQEVKEKGKKLNIKGLQSLLRNNANQTFAENQIEEFRQTAEENIEQININDALTENQKAKQISKIEEVFASRLKAASLLLAEAKQNQANLIIGEQASPLTIDVIKDEYGNDIVIGGLSSQDYFSLTKEGEENAPSMIELKLSNLKQTGKDIYNQLVEKGMNMFEGLKSKITKSKEETEETEETEEEILEEKIEDEVSDEIKTDEETKKPDLKGLESIEDEVFSEFEKSGFVPDEILDNIAERVNKEEGLSPRETAIQESKKDDILERIVKLTLGTDKKKQKKPSVIDNLSNNDIAELEKTNNVSIKRTDEGYDIISNKTNKKPSKKIIDQINASIESIAEENIKSQEDKNLSKEENEFVQEEIQNKKEGESIEDVEKAKNQKASEEFKVNPEKAKDAAKKIGLDRRESKKGINIRDINILSFQKTKAFIQKLGKSKNIKDRESISQNEVDNFLNSFSTHNVFGPGKIHQMAVVNHQLKRMFPNSNDPVQVVVVKNLFEALGSQGLGHALLGTIYIDEKAWNQDNIFMHEMSHIFYQLTKDDPGTQNVLTDALKNKGLFEEIKKRYDDYTLYELIVPGGSIELTKSQLLNYFAQEGADMNQLEGFLERMINEGDVKKLPLKQQKYILEELFVAQLEGPLSKSYDKLFNPKDEIKRQKDTKIWWGLMRKKGAIIEEDKGAERILRLLHGENNVPLGDLKSFVLDEFKKATKNISLSGFGLDARVDKSSEEYQNEIALIHSKKLKQLDNPEPEELSSFVKELDRIDAMDNALENDGQMFYNTDFDSKVKSTSRILRRFGIVYNKALRTKNLIETKDKVTNRKKFKLFDRDEFESFVYNLATENNNSNEFIYQIENSEITEIQAFNRYLDKMFPDNKYQLLNSMHFVLSNSKHIVGFRNTINDKGEHKYVNSLSNKELNSAENVLSRLLYAFRNRKDGTEWNDFQQAVLRIYDSPIPESKDIMKVVQMLAPRNFKLHKVQEDGYITYRGVNVPIETLIKGFIDKGLLFNENTKQVYYANARPLIEALINTNRKYSPLSSVKNAEGNMEPVRITNNHLTKEVDDMISFLQGNEKSKPTLEEFLNKFSHLAHPNKESLGKSYVPNQFLENIYNQFQDGILPTISQYHGLEDIDNANGSLYKNSTALEQNIEDMLTFISTSTNENGKRLKAYLGNMGTFADSPRKFFMNMKRIRFDEVFIEKNGKFQFNPDGKIINSIFNIHNNSFADEVSNNKTKFKNHFREAINNQIQFVRDNATELSQIDKMKGLFKSGKLTSEGVKTIAEYTINSIVNGYNVLDTFLPGVKGKDISKRFKMNSSPVMSVKNPNLKIEPIFFNDEEINGSIAGTDSGMYILKEHAEMFQRLGKGVFDMKGGFKFLNASIEKDNPNFKNKTAYLKGYTTIVDETHPLYKLLKARSNKYKEWHQKTFGEEPSKDLSDGTFNHIPIAVPESSDKSNFIPESFKEKNFSEQALNENIDDAMKYYDELYYDKKGNFLGLNAYNFGPQQLMDKKNERANTPVQMINSIIVNATLNGQIELANKIQSLISEQKRDNLQKILDQIKSESIEDYTKIIKEGLNYEDMNQAQRVLLEDNGSLAHPYINEIVVNQLAKTIRRAGNKLLTPGTYAHQKPDSGWRFASKENKALKGYVKNSDGSNTAAEIVLPSHMQDKVVSREKLTHNSSFGRHAIKNAESALGKKQRETFELLRKNNELMADMMLLEFGALDLAKRRHGLTSDKEAQKYIGKEYDKNHVHIGYHVKGETVIASRVPGHGPSSTGVFEVIGFDKGEGNQVMVSSEFNEIIGSDNDGDALFIQTKANLRTKEYQNYKKWNEAFDLMTKYWLSPEMSDQITAKMVFKEETESIVQKVNEQYPKNKEYITPFSPQARMSDYNNTMVSKRSIGPVFNIHKITNIMAATNVKLIEPIKINNVIYDGFKDIEKGNNSRNQQSAILANIILDNTKYSFADNLGLNEYNISQAVLMVNLGIPLEEVGKILNSPAAKLWSELNRNSNSKFHKNKNKSTIKKEIYDKLKIKENKIKSLKISMSNIHLSGPNQSSVVELLDYLSNMNSEIQKISTIMGGHNKIHVNPLVLEQQIKDFDNTIKNDSENRTLELTDQFRFNPDMKHYVDVARQTLKHQKNLNPVYTEATKGVLDALTSKIGNDLSASQIEDISKDILKFKTSRLLNLNNKPKEYIENLLSTDPNNQESIFNKMKVHLNYLTTQIFEDSNDVKQHWTMLQNSVLFEQALSLSLDGPKDKPKYISANPAFVNDSFNEIERERAQEEFMELPQELRNDLIVYDLIKHGWKGPLSMAPFFGKETNFLINYFATRDVQDKITPLSPVVAKELERIIALRASRKHNNPFDKVYTQDLAIKKPIFIVRDILKNQKVYEKISKGQPVYINLIDTKNSKSRKLFEMEKFTPEEVAQVVTERTQKQKLERVLTIAATKIKEVPDNLIGNGDIDISTIEDKNIGTPYSVFDEGKNPEYLNYMVEASINYEEVMAKIRREAQNKALGLDAREDFYIDTFTKKEPLLQSEYEKAMEFKTYMSPAIKKSMYDQYVSEKDKANKLIEKGVLNNLENKSSEELLKMYNTFGQRDVYAFSGIITPVVKQLAKNLASEQAELFRKNNVKANPSTEDVSLMKAYMMSGSTIPSNHPASQSLVRMLEGEYKNFINEKKKYIQEMNQITDNLYKEKLGYGSGISVRNVLYRIKDSLFSNRQEIYDRLYGNLVIREEGLDDKGRLLINFKLRPIEEIENGFKEGYISKAEKEFYDFFRKTTEELRPKNIEKEEYDYIPHTSMSKLEAFSNRGLLGLLVNSRHEDQAIYDVKMKFNGELVNFKQIEDFYKYQSARGFKNDFSKIKEYRDYRNKAKKLLQTGQNEDGSKILFDAPLIETALGFGAINRFANNRSVKARELPSMDLNKALGDYIHSSLFVNGNPNFQGMEKLQGYIDGVLAWNQENNLPNLNQHIQKIWKDYFLRGRRQTSFLGETADRVIIGLTRLNLFYALGYSANKNTGGLYVIGNILAGKYHNIKDVGGKAWIKGELRYWGLDKGFKGGIQGVIDRHKRMQKIMRNLNFMEINVYDEVNIEKKSGLDSVFAELALLPMKKSEEWIQRVHMIGLLEEEELNRFDEAGNYKEGEMQVPNEKLIMLEDRVKSSHGRGYQPTDQRAIQMYSWGAAMLQFSRFIPTMVHDRFAKEDVNIYGRETIGTITAVGKMLRYVMNNPSDFVEYRKSLSEEQRQRLDSGLKGMAMSTVISMLMAENNTAKQLFWDTNYYWNYPKLSEKLVPASIQSVRNLTSQLF